MGRHKRLVVWLLLFALMSGVFVSGVSHVDVSADSNDRRRQFIDLATGKSLLEIENISDIDMDSLRAVALYLSNFYVPYSTVLSPDYKNESGTTMRDDMLQALTKACGVNKDAAEYLVDYVLQASLQTCRQLYVKEQELDDYVSEKIGITTRLDNCLNPGEEFKSDIKVEVEFAKNVENYSDEAKAYLKIKGVGFGVGEVNSKKTSTTTNNDDIVSDSNEYRSSIILRYFDHGSVWHDGSHMNGWIKNSELTRYFDVLGGRKVVGSVSYVPLSYSFFMQIMGQPSSNIMTFYWYDLDSDKMVSCFDNSYSCRKSFAVVTSKTRFEHGVGSGFCLVDMESFGNVRDSDKLKTTVLGQRVFVNWVGDLVLDDNDLQYVILPGCANPYMFGRIEGSDITENVLNFFYMQKFFELDGYKRQNNDVNKYIFDTSKNYLFQLHCWCLTRNHAEIALDSSDSAKDWGAGENIINYIKNKNNAAHYFLCYSYAKDDIDPIAFPKWYGLDNMLVADSLWVDLSNVMLVCSTNSSGSDLSMLVQKGNVVEICESQKNLSVISEGSVLDYGFTATYRQNTALRRLFQPLFITYAFAYFNKDATQYSDEYIIDLKVHPERFPSDTTMVEWQSFSVDSTADEVMSFVYYLLHPTKGIAYVATWVKNKISGIFVGWHEDIVGSSDSNSSTGMTRYLGFSGYVTTPSLFDIDWISDLLSGYNNIVVYLIIVIAIVLLSYIIIGQMTVQRALIGFVMFGVLAFLPPVAINTVVNVSNQAADTIYSAKFDYWALMQLQTYIGQLNRQSESQRNGDVNDYIASILEINMVTGNGVGGDSETGYTGVKIKWIAPKKFNTMAELSEAMDKTYDTNGMWLKRMVLTSMNQASSGETFLDSDNALYIYRDALDLYRYASSAYNLYSAYSCTPSAGGKDLRTNESSLLHITPWEGHNAIIGHWSSNNEYHKYLKQIKYSSGQKLNKYIIYNLEDTNTYLSADDVYRDTSSLNAIRKGFLVDTVGVDNLTSNSGVRPSYYQQTGSLATSLFLNYGYVLNSVHYQYNRLLSQVSKDDASMNLSWDNMNPDSGSSVFFGLRNDMFNVSVSTVLNMRNTLYSGKTTEKEQWYKDFSGLYYELYEESPFFYFSFNIQDQMWKLVGLGNNSRGSNYYYNPENLGETHNNFKDMLLLPGQSYFFNMAETAGDGYGELRDFMNFHDLFYYIIPALGDSVELCRLFDDVFGLYLYDDCNLSVDTDGKFYYDGKVVDFTKDTFEEWYSFTDEEKYKFWHNYNVIGIMNSYCAWLDTMYDCDYAKGQTIPIMGKKYYVENPLDPTSYFKVKDGVMTEGRYMVFSRSEMAYYGLRESDLTTVERKIIEVQDNVYKKSIDLLNYYTLSDEVLIQSYALLQTFEFNKVFSQNSLLGEDYTLYPQGYELKAFTYDAYLRLIIAGAAGEDIMSSTLNSDGTNISIYQRVLSKTSLFFGIVLLINDFVAVYLIPGLKLFFLVAVFLLSVFMIISSAIKLELNLLTVTMKCLIAPLGAFAVISVGMAWLVSLFMSGGGQGVTRTSTTVYVGDPTMVVIVMVIINVAALVLYWKLCRKCFKDAVKFAKAIVASMGGAVAGAVNRVVGSVVQGKMAGRAYAKAAGAGAAGTAKQRGVDNKPTSGKSGLGTALAAGVAGGIVSEAVRNKAQDAGGMSGGANRYDSKITAAGEAYNKAKEKDKARSAQGKFESRMQGVDERLDRAADAKEVFLHGKGLRNRLKAGAVAAKEGVGARKDQLKANVKYAGGRLARAVHVGSDESYDTQILGARATRLKKDSGKSGSELRPEIRQKKKVEHIANKQAKSEQRSAERTKNRQVKAERKAEAKQERASAKEEKKQLRAAKAQEAAERKAAQPRLNMQQKSEYRRVMAGEHNAVAKQKGEDAAVLRRNGHRMAAVGMGLSAKASRVKAAANLGVSRAYTAGDAAKDAVSNGVVQAKASVGYMADKVKNSTPAQIVTQSVTKMTNKASETVSNLRNDAVITARMGADKVKDISGIVGDKVQKAKAGAKVTAGVGAARVADTVDSMKNKATSAVNKVQGVYSTARDSVGYVKRRGNVYNDRIKLAKESALNRALRVKQA